MSELKEFANYKIVILDNIFENTEKDLAKYFFPRILNEKKKGYHHSHTHNYLPIGQDDFICTYLSVCEEKSGDYIPVCVAKLIPYSRCEYYNVPFPFFDLLESCMISSDFNSIVSEVEKVREKNVDFTYSGGWTINPDYRGKSDISQFLREIYTAMSYLVHEQNNYHSIFGFGCPRFKTDKFFQAWGADIIQNNGMNIKSIKASKLNGEEIIPLHCQFDKISKWKKDMAEKYFPLWDQRIEIKNIVDPAKIHYFQKLKKAA